jgi:general secretion pathway protein M
VEKTVKKYLITVTRMQNSGASQVSVSLGDVEFPSLMKWAADLEQNWHIRVSSIDIVGMGQGVVKVNRIVLEKNEN